MRNVDDGGHKLDTALVELSDRKHESRKFRTTWHHAAGRKPKPADPAVDPDTVANVTDPDSGIMKTRHGWPQGYNAQIVVTVGQIILAADVTTEANDVRQLTPMLDQAPQFAALAVIDACLFSFALSRFRASLSVIG